MTTESSAPEGVKPETVDTGKKFTQEDLNRVAANERRKATAEAMEAKAAHEALRNQVEELLGGRPIDEVRAEMEQTAAKLRSTEDNFKIEQSKNAKALKDAMEKATLNEQRYRDLAITRALKDAALPKAERPKAADLIVKLLIDRAEVNDQGIVTVEMEVEEEGVRVKRKVTPEQAVTHLEEKPEDYGPLFKSTVNSGTGLPPGRTLKNGGVDPSSLTMAQYMKLRSENPEAVGVK